jgi:hypothetical protein
MGKVVTFASLQYQPAATGVTTAAITGGDGKEMRAVESITVVMAWSWNCHSHR